MKAQGASDPKVYLSKSEGRFRVIYQGQPLSSDKLTEKEALAACGGLDVAPVFWDGDIGEWVKRVTA